MSWVERWIEGSTRRPAFQSARGLAAVSGALFVVAVVIDHLQGDETWVGLAVAACVAFISAACAASLLREKRRTEAEEDGEVQPEVDAKGAR